MALFQDLHSQGKTIAFVTHEPDIAAFTTRIIRLRDGRIVEDTPNTPLSAEEQLNN
jgi:putative ABC transport system ATP-binding protein